MAEILSGIGSALRPAAKQVIKGGLLVTNAVSNLTSGAGDEFKDLLKEARSEVNDMHAARRSKAKVEPEGLCSHLAKAGHTVWDAAWNLPSAVNAGIVAMVAWWTGESKEEAREHVEKREERIEHLARELTIEEGATVIETLLVAAV